MSEHPLSPQNLTIIAVAASINMINDAVAQYGTDAAGVTVAKVVTVADAAFARATYPALTPWCILAHADEFAVNALQGYFGPARSLAKCLDMRNNDYAINPRLLQI